ncbi:MAG: PQQ-dependent sugar dehydrogenase [Bacteroidota bacterium]
MNKYLFFITFFLFFNRIEIFAQQENFTQKRVINTQPLSHPFAMVMGPEDSLWVTERPGLVQRVNTVNGNKTLLLDIRNLVMFTVSSDRLTIAQDGMFGIALHPELNKNTGNDFVYIAYCYNAGSGNRKTKIVRYNYNRSIPNLSGATVLLSGIPASNDHNSGRLIIGNIGTSELPDYKLFYTVGDGGANQFSNACKQIQSQNTPTIAEMNTSDYHTYAGKSLCINLDGSIPSDNPVFNGVRSHIYSIGHRNAQGLAFEKDPAGALIPKGKLYNSEQGPAVSDEVNIIKSGKNYGWPRVAGMQDDIWYKYYDWSASGKCSTYSGECSSNQINFGLLESSFSDINYLNPIFDMYPIPPVQATCTNYLTNPTVAPSSIAYYHFTNKIPGWYRSLLVPTLKRSALLRLQLDDSGTTVIGDTIQYFRDETALNRYRDIVIGNDGITLYLLTDSTGSTSGPTSGVNGGVTDRGRILAFKYIGEIFSCPNQLVSIVAPTSGGNTYQWQVDNGGGYIDLVNNDLYSGVINNTLVIANAPTTMYGYKYRCRITKNTIVTYTKASALRFSSIWTGAIDHAWENPGNWDCGIVPDNKTDVVVNAGTITVNSIVTINSLRINPKVSLTINSGKEFNVLH